MKFLHNLSIGTRLGLCSALVLVLTAAIAAIAQYGMSGLHDEIDTIVSKDWTKNKLATAALDNTRGSIARVFQVIQEADKANLAKARERFAANAKVLQESLSQLVPLVYTEEGKAQLAKCKASTERYLASAERVFALVDSANRDAAGKLAYGETYTALHTLAADLRDFNDLQQQRLEAAGARSTEAANRGRVLVIALGAIALLLGAAASWLVTRSVTQPMRRAIDAANRVKEGDLSTAIESSGRDETAQLLAAMAAMSANLRQVVGAVRSGVDSVTTASTQIASGNQDLSARTEQQASNLQETASSMEELTSTIQQNADNAKQANQLAAAASETASRGGAVVQRVVGDDERDHRSQQAHRRHHPGDRRHRVPDQHPGAQRSGRGGARRRTGSRLCGRGLRGAQPGAAQRAGGQGDQGPDRRLGAEGRRRRGCWWTKRARR